MHHPPSSPHPLSINRYYICASLLLKPNLTLPLGAPFLKAQPFAHARWRLPTHLIHSSVGRSAVLPLGTSAAVSRKLGSDRGHHRRGALMQSSLHHSVDGVSGASGLTDAGSGVGGGGRRGSVVIEVHAGSGGEGVGPIDLVKQLH